VSASTWKFLAARIDAPLLGFDCVKITFFNQLVFDIPQTIRFFGHSDSFRTSSLTLSFNLESSEATFNPSDIGCVLNIRCDTLDWQVFSMAQICSQSLPFCSSIESLIIEYVPNDTDWDPLPEIEPDEIDPTVWLQLFHSFPSVQSLQISAMLELSIAAALQGLTGESAAEAFPSLHGFSIVVDDDDESDQAVPQGIQSYVTARQHCGHPIAVSRRHK
jgi:hypothetical protein